LESHYKFVSVLICVVMGVVEVARMYLGYEGNLREKVDVQCIALSVHIVMYDVLLV